MTQDADADTGRYSLVAIALHWSIALLVMAQLATGYWMSRALATADLGLVVSIYQWHKSVGIVVLLLSVARLAWRIVQSPPPPPRSVSALRWRVASVVHALLYAATLAVPMAGWLLVSSSSLAMPTDLFGWLPWPHLPAPRWLEPMVAALHRGLAWALACLAIGHIAAALHQHYRVGTGSIGRMLP